MSRLDELIAELCPNGVPVVELGDVIKFLNGRAYKQEELLTNGKYKVLRVGNFFTNESWYYSNLELSDDKFCYDGDLLYAWAASLGPQIWHGGKTIFHYHIWKLLFDESVIDKRFLFHFLKKDIDSIKNSLTNSTMPHVSMKNMKARVMPLPPLPVQEEIVRILDNFTELSAELSARENQYEYYLNHLLSFADDIKRKTLGEVCNLSAGGDVPKDRYSKIKTEKYCIPIYSNGINENALYGYTDTAKIIRPSVTISARGTIGYSALRVEPFYPIIRLICAVPKKEVTPEYLLYAIQTIKFQVPATGIPQLTVPMVSKYEIPVPSLDEQIRIVNILDRFSTLCNSITIGLPAEIDARRKQYEYYRDKLLTFQEA